MINSFEELNLNLNIIEGLKKQNITLPTHIQSLAIPLALENKDIIAEAYTGSGKTLAFLAPIFQKINDDKREMQAIILAPTHELVIQIESQIKLLSQNSNMKVTSLSIIGEANIDRQVKKLKEIKPHIIVGTCGRVLDLIKKKKIAAHTIKTIVIDEADNLLDEKNIENIEGIIKSTMRDRQLMCFSATINEKAINVAKDLMKEPTILKTTEKSLINPNIEHMYVLCEQREKFDVLRKLIAATNPNKSIVFTNKAYDIEKVVLKLNYHDKNTFGLYGNIDKEKRRVAIESFRNGKIHILVSSDLSARGMDVCDVTHIFNLDLPRSSKEYLHRSGRTARGNASGTSICLVTKYELNDLKKYEKDLNIKFQGKSLFKGSLKDLK